MTGLHKLQKNYRCVAVFQSVESVESVERWRQVVASRASNPTTWTDVQLLVVVNMNIKMELSYRTQSVRCVLTKLAMLFTWCGKNGTLPISCLASDL
jgi:hypothetical protein